MAFDVFISYNQGDLEWAAKLKADLEGRNISAFLAPENIRAGAEWEKTLAQAISDARVFVVLWSDANAGKSKWVAAEGGAFRMLIYQEEKRGAGGQRQLLQVCLDGRNTDFGAFQSIDDLLKGAQFAKGAANVDINLWNSVLQKIDDAVKYDPNAPRVHQLILASTATDLAKVPGDFSPTEGSTFGDLLKDLKISKTELLAQYTENRSEWKPFLGEKNIRTILAELRVEIRKQKGGPNFQWAPVGEEFWTLHATDQAFEDIIKQLQREPAVIVVDAVSLYEKKVFARCQWILDCMYNASASIVVLPPFGPGQREVLRKAVALIANVLHNRFWTPEFIEGRIVRASCAITAPDALEMRRLLANALVQSRGEIPQWWKLVDEAPK